MAQELKRKQQERSSTDFPWKELVEDGKLEKLRVRELDIYLKRHGLTTSGRKDAKVKAIWCHFFRQTTENESDVSDTDGETETESEERG